MGRVRTMMDHSSVPVWTASSSPLTDSLVLVRRGLISRYHNIYCCVVNQTSTSACKLRTTAVSNCALTLTVAIFVNVKVASCWMQMASLAIVRV